MRRINKSVTPAGLQEYVRKIGASYSDIDKDVYDAILLSLLNEQGWVCGYCQQQIKDVSRASIEHFCEQSICNGQHGSEDLRLSYANMMAVCPGDAGFSQFHCDKSKAKFNSNNGLPIEVSPWISPHMAAISYTGSGLVSSSFIRHNDEINRILNLNIGRLKQLRKEKYQLIYTLSKNNHQTILIDKMKRLLESELDRAGGKYVGDFPGLSEWMLRKYCR